MSDIPTKTYPPECLHAMIADHEAEQAGATSEASSAVETKGDTMSYITRWKVSGPATRLRPDADGPWVALVDYYRVIDRLIAERDAARGEVERLTAERDMARAEVRRLIAERDQPESRPKGRERGRFGWDGHYIYGMEPAQRTDEEIWREAFMTLLPSYPWEKAAAHADSALAEYRKRWPR